MIIFTQFNPDKLDEASRPIYDILMDENTDLDTKLSKLKEYRTETRMSGGEMHTTLLKVFKCRGAKKKGYELIRYWANKLGK